MKFSQYLCAHSTGPTAFSGTFKHHKQETKTFSVSFDKDWV